MTAPLSANQALAIVNHCPFPLLALARGELDDRHPATNCAVTVWRRNDNATRLLKHSAIALSPARAEHGKQSLAL